MSPSQTQSRKHGTPSAVAAVRGSTFPTRLHPNTRRRVSSGTFDATAPAEEWRLKNVSLATILTRHLGPLWRTYDANVETFLHVGLTVWSREKNPLVFRTWREGPGRSAAPTDRPAAEGTPTAWLTGSPGLRHHLTCTGYMLRLWRAHLQRLFAHRVLHVFEWLVVIQELVSTNHINLHRKYVCDHAIKSQATSKIPGRVKTSRNKVQFQWFKKKKKGIIIRIVKRSNYSTVVTCW